MVAIALIGLTLWLVFCVWLLARETDDERVARLADEDAREARGEN